MLTVWADIALCDALVHEACDRVTLTVRTVSEALIILVIVTVPIDVDWVRVMTEGAVDAQAVTVEGFESMVIVTVLEAEQRDAELPELAGIDLTELDCKDNAVVLGIAVIVTVLVKPDKATDCVTVIVLFDAGWVWITVIVWAGDETCEAVGHDKLAL